MSGVRRDSVAGRAYLDVQNLARRLRRPTGELLHLYALEGFLDRLSRSLDADRLVLKGGMLLAVWDARRPTRDIDLSGHRISGEVEDVLALVRRVAGIDIDDGLSFDAESATAEPIREDDDYSGVRVILPATLARAVLRFHIDVSVGDVIAPPPTEVELPRLLGTPPLRVLAYPLGMVLAEKVVTMVERAEANTRWRDFADVYLLTRTRDADAEEVRVAFASVAASRNVELRPIAELLAVYPGLAQRRWVAWRNKQLLDQMLPEQFIDVLQAVAAFADPIIAHVASPSDGAS